MSTSPAEIRLEITPRARFDVIDINRRIADEHGDVLGAFPRALYFSYHTTAGYLEQALSTRLNGGKDGLQVGNRIFVVRRGDGYRPIMEGWDAQDASFPKELVAELWVVDVRDKAAVAWVARSSKELRVGEVAELRKGH